MGCDTKIAAAVWAPSYARATVMQAFLATVSLLSGVAAWLPGGGAMWPVGAVFVGLVVPFTFVAIMPTNKHLLSPGTRVLLERWGKLHTVRSLLSFAAALLLTWSRMRPDEPPDSDASQAALPSVHASVRLCCCTLD